jgi:transcriptional regulatory protein LevR
LGIPVTWQPQTVDLAAGYLQRAGTCPEGQQVLAILGTPEPALDWSELQKIYEIIGDHVAVRATDGARRDRRQALTATGLVIAENLDAFTGRTMTIEDARHVITNLVLAWLDWL